MTESIENEDDDNTAERVCDIISGVLFLLTICFAIFNMWKFWQHRNFSLGIFYVIALISLSSHIVFVVCDIVSSNRYWLYIYFGMLPSYMVCSIGIT